MLGVLLSLPRMAHPIMGGPQVEGREKTYSGMANVSDAKGSPLSWAVGWFPLGEGARTASPPVSPNSPPKRN